MSFRRSSCNARQRLSSLETFVISNATSFSLRVFCHTTQHDAKQSFQQITSQQLSSNQYISFKYRQMHTHFSTGSHHSPLQPWITMPCCCSPIARGTLQSLFPTSLFSLPSTSYCHGIKSKRPIVKMFHSQNVP